MSTQNTTGSDKDQFPHTDLANNEEGGTPGEKEAGRPGSTREPASQRNRTQERRATGNAEGERDPDEQRK